MWGRILLRTWYGSRNPKLSLYCCMSFLYCFDLLPRILSCNSGNLGWTGIYIVQWFYQTLWYQKVFDRQNLRLGQSFLSRFLAAERPLSISAKVAEANAWWELCKCIFSLTNLLYLYWSPYILTVANLRFNTSIKLAEMYCNTWDHHLAEICPNSQLTYLCQYPNCAYITAQWSLRLEAGYMDGHSSLVWFHRDDLPL